VVADLQKIVYVVMVRFSEAEMVYFRGLLVRAGSILNFFAPLHTGVGLAADDVGKKIIADILSSFPGAPDDAISVIESRLAKLIALWRLRWSSEFPIGATRRIKSFITMMYNRWKGGVDRHSKVMVSVLDHLNMRHSPNSWIVWRLFAVPIANALLMARAHKVRHFIVFNSFGN
jgi:hypothetical protein